MKRPNNVVQTDICSPVKNIVDRITLRKKIKLFDSNLFSSNFLLQNKKIKRKKYNFDKYEPGMKSENGQFNLP